MRPLVGWGQRLSERADRGGIGSSALLGVETGLLWAPCAGPILGIILTGAALSGANATTGPRNSSTSSISRPQKKADMRVSAPAC